jgi:preprotein translocase subunit SecY
MGIAVYSLDDPILKNNNALVTGYNEFFMAAVIVASFTAGSAIVMWLGERINQKGIGNGISIILFVSIATQFPTFVMQIFAAAEQKLAWGIIILIIFAVMIVLIVAMNDGERRIPVQYAKKVVGRKMYGGQSTFLPLKVTMSGVLPIIFASAFVSMPSLIASFFPQSGFALWLNANFGYTSWAYALVYFLLIIAFNFFYVSVQYNPVEMANNIQKNGGFVFGLRPGAPTADYIKKVLNKITIVGAICLAFIAIVPIFYQMGTGIQVALGGTSIIIVVGVILETMKSLESQMLMRHYKGFLD